MNCPSCAAPNPDDHRFCSSCGKALPSLCASCGFANDSTAKFCGGCGSALQVTPTETSPQSDQSASTALDGEAERRQLTVMFCDLVGSTALSEGLDSEDLRDVLRRYQDAAASHITAQEGFIARYMGDGLLVYFGYPQAHENDAERAIRAGLEITREVGGMTLDDGRALSVRIGIATGQVVVGDIVGHGAAEERAVLGDTPNLAARLQGVAVPGAVVVSETTRELAGALFQYSDLGPQQLKGIKADAVAFAVSGESTAHSHSEIAANMSAGGDAMAMVGRDTELDILLLQWKAVAGGAAKTVWLKSDAGMGKSRLVRAFEDSLADADHSTLICYCSSAYSNSTYFPLKGGLRSLLGISADQTPADTATLLRDYLDAEIHCSAIVHMLHDEVPGDLPHLPDDPAAARQVLVDAFRALLTRLTQVQPVLFVLEDAHWVDPSTHDFMAALLSGGGVPGCLFLIAARPESTLEPPIGAMTITLAELPPDAAKLIVQHALDADVERSELTERIMARAGGSPLFLEELGKAMRVSADQRAIPTTLQDALMARLDSLGSDKAIAQAASVIGRSFSIRALATVTGNSIPELESALDRLSSADFLDAVVGDDHPYMFRHVLMQETAYQSILKSSRVRLHGVLASALTGELASLVADHPELVAHHFDQAGDFASAAQYWEQGGQRAVSRSAHVEAIGFFANAVDAILEMPESEERSVREMQLLTDMVGSMRIADRLDDALLQLDRAQETANLVGSLNEQSNLYSLRGNILFGMGDSEASLEAHEKALELARDDKDPEMEARALSGLGDACFISGDLAASLSYFSQCLELSHAAGLNDIAITNLAMHGHLQIYMNNLPQAREDCRKSAEQAATMGLKRAEMIARASCYAKVLFDLGELDASAAELRQGLDLSNELGAGRFQPMYYSHLALICACQNDVEDFLRHREQALATLNPTSSVFVGAVSLATLAHASSVLGRMDDAIQYLQQGKTLIGDNTPFHGLLWFGRFAVETAIRLENWDEATRYAKWLGGRGRNNPVPWAEFFAARGHVLVSLGRDPEDQNAIGKAAALAVEARDMSHLTALTGLEN